VVSFARSERLALCDEALAVGSDAPTLCTGWTVKDLLVHLLIRERRPWAVPGLFVRRLSPLMARAEAEFAAQPLEDLVVRLRDPRPTPYAVDAVERAVNTIEFFVHHEDVRRAQPSWRARPLSPGAERDLWRALRVLGRGLVRPAGVPVVVSDGTTSATLRRGPDPARVTGAVGELVLFLFGRAAHDDLTFDGPPAKVAALRSAKLGF